MSRPSNREAPDATPIASKPAFIVARRRTVRVQGRSLGPGSPVDLPEAELMYLEKAGFIVRSGEPEPAGSGVRVGGLQIRGGQKAAGSIV